MKIGKKTLSILALMMTTAITGFSTLKGYTQEKPKTFQLDQITCRALFKMDNDEEELTLLFFHGFISGKNNQTSLDASVLTETTDKIVDHCIDNPNDTLMSVFEKYRAGVTQY